MHFSRIVVVFLLLFSIAGCSTLFRNPFGGGGDDDDDTPDVIPNRVIEPTVSFALAVGGVAPGRDELVIYENENTVRNFSGKTLVCAADDDIVLLRPRPGFETAAAGSGVQMVATAPGITAIRCTMDGTEMKEVYEVTIPPQSLIQILVAEAGAQLASEAKFEEGKDDVVKLASVSPTGNALGSAIRNRIHLININEDPSLFGADPGDYNINPPASYYDGIIEAEGQFAPTDFKDPTHKTFENAQDRNFLEGDWLIAYDQAVLTAAGIFNGDLFDSTGGAFAFRSPNAQEWGAILAAWTSFSTTTPDASGFSDADFPAFAPLQILIHPDVQKSSDGRPAFVFARKRTNEFAVANTP